MKSLSIQDYSVVKRINGSQGGYLICKLSFKNMDGTEISKVELSNAKPYGQESLIAEDEEIIGVFGRKDEQKYVTQIGFIVWKPTRI
jgi:hypothetical protein